MYQTNRPLFITVAFCLIFFSSYAQNPAITLPKIGVNGQLSSYDPMNVNYSSLALSDAVNELQLSFIRFPGGTSSSSYNWVAFDWNENGSRQFSILDKETAFAREGSHLGVNDLEGLGCLENVSWQSHKSFVDTALIKSNDLLSDFKANVIDGQKATPVYVVRVFDPFYYIADDGQGGAVGSAFFNLNDDSWTPDFIAESCGDNVRCIIKRTAIADLRRILLKIMYEYNENPQDSSLYNVALNHRKLYKKPAFFNLEEILDIPTQDLIVHDKIYFELGNELYDGLYSKFLPVAGNNVAPCTSEEALADPELYADIVADILPFIKQYFPNAKVGVIAGNRRRCSFWTTQVVTALKDIPFFDDPSFSTWDKIDALTLHFYSATDSLLDIQDPTISSLLSYRRKLLDAIANESEENFENKTVWITELGFPSEEYTDQRPYIGTWFETLMMLSYIHEIGLRERFVQDYLDRCTCENRKLSLRNSWLFPDFMDIEMVLLHTLGANYIDSEIEFQGVLRGEDLNGDLRTDDYKLTSLGLAMNLYRQLLSPETPSGQLEFLRSLPLIPPPVYVDSMEIIRKCAYIPKPKDMVQFNGVLGMRAYKSLSSPNMLQDMFINMTDASVNVSSWSLPFMSNGIIDHVWTYKAAGLSQDLLLDMGNLRSDLFSISPFDVLPNGTDIGLDISYSNSNPSLVMPPYSVMLVGRRTISGTAVDDHGMSEEEYRSSKESSGIKLFPSALIRGSFLTITSEFPGMYSIHDALGRLVDSGTIQEQLRFNTSGLNPGVYLVNVYREGEHPSIAKFTVLH